MKLKVQRLNARDAGFDATLRALTRQSGALDAKVDSAVATILADVEARGDAALVEYTARFDRLTVKSAGELIIEKSELASAWRSLDPQLRDALQAAATRIQLYHEKQVQASWSYHEPDGLQLGQLITPMERVGLYVPGGLAAYPSSLLMNAVTAKVAGVPEVVMVTPTPDGVRNPVVLGAAHLAGIERVFTIGGAQAIGALAYGTATVPAVDKIVGPGNAYVAAAKRRVFGQVGIDMVAGPSEIVVIADDSANPEWVAMDLFSQAEHDESAQAILISPSRDVINRVEAAMMSALPTLPRAAIAAASLNGRGAFIEVRDIAEACDVSNLIAPEHLELVVADPDAVLPALRHAGAIFVGRYASESLGDYCAGPNHVLPTSGTARFSSPLGVYDFVKRTSLIRANAASAARLGPIAAKLAHSEGLQAHARAAELRLSQP